MQKLWLLFPCLLLFSCKTYLPNVWDKTQEAKTAQDWINYSIAYHDPQNNWPRFKAQIESYSKVDRGADTLQTSTRRLAFENPRSYFDCSMKVKNYTMNLKLDEKTCVTTWDKPDVSQEERDRYYKECAFTKNYRDYYRYLIGIPMVLKDELTIVNPSVEEETIDGKSYKRITVNYAPVDKHPTWQFYIDPGSGRLVRSKFFRYNEKEKKHTGEILDYPEHQLFQGMQMRTKMIWYYLDQKFLADESYTYKDF